MSDLIMQKDAAAVLGCTDRSIRNLIARGDLTGYRVRGLRAVRVSRREVLGLLETMPTVTPRRPARPKPPAKVPYASGRVVQAIVDAEGNVVGTVPLTVAAKTARADA